MKGSRCYARILAPMGAKVAGANTQPCAVLCCVALRAPKHSDARKSVCSTHASTPDFRLTLLCLCHVSKPLCSAQDSLSSSTQSLSDHNVACQRYSCLDLRLNKLAKRPTFQTQVRAKAS